VSRADLIEFIRTVEIQETTLSGGGISVPDGSIKTGVRLRGKTSGAAEALRRFGPRP
jgi:hypothetical protein